MGTEFPEINEDDTFGDADFIYESQPDIVEEIQEISDEPLTESETEIENNIPVEDELNTILEKK
ncbi:MAG: hypothetical protein ACUVRG_09375 [Ignavibacterium sp.]|uniref:hypothetical protein n=1 Tax=Ignavibacterium sp. TaxID=2651167 RepID=UPI00404A2D13